MTLFWKAGHAPQKGVQLNVFPPKEKDWVGKQPLKQKWQEQYIANILFA